MFLATVILLLSCIEITSSSSTVQICSVFSSIKHAHDHSLYGRTGTYADDIIKISRINRLPDLFTNGAPRAPLSTAELILTIFLFFSVSYRGGRKGGPKTAKPHRKTQKKKLPWGPEAFLARFPVANTRFA